MASDPAAPTLDPAVNTNVVVVHASPSRRVRKSNILLSRIPEEILNHPALVLAQNHFPKNYDFEFAKSIWRIKQLNAKRVAIQLPEGLQMYAIKISDLFEETTGVDIVILGDVTYGACCVDDFMARTLKVDLLIHYGHSCLVPVDLNDDINFLYVFVNIQIDITHVEHTILYNFPPSQKLALVSTVQFVTALHEVGSRLQEKGYTCLIPQKKPLTPGEILGCTAPSVPDDYLIIYLGDGRFHLEAVMIANPKCRYMRYDPYEKKLTDERYNHYLMREFRAYSILRAREASRVGIIFGTLGRQGSLNVLGTLRKYFDKRNTDPTKPTYQKDYVLVLLSEIYPYKLNLFGSTVNAWIQVACPRLSIDWGQSFDKPLLTPYEAHIAFSEEHIDSAHRDSYPMDYYADDSLGPWTPKHNPKKSTSKCCNTELFICDCE